MAGQESVRDVYFSDDPKEAVRLLDKAIRGCRSDDVEEIRSLGDTLNRWRKEILGGLINVYARAA
jgi:hypothetical protein